METSKPVLVEGLFHVNGLGYTIQPPGYDTPQVVVSSLFEPFAGKRVLFVMHHLPPDLQNPDPTKWGGGCCAWQPGECPAGHHYAPHFLLNVQRDGTVRPRNGDLGWNVSTVESLETPLLAAFQMMVGHHGRLAMVPLFDQLDPKPMGTEDLAAIQGLQAQLKDLQDVFGRLK